MNLRLTNVYKAAYKRTNMPKRLVMMRQDQLVTFFQRTFCLFFWRDTLLYSGACGLAVWRPDHPKTQNLQLQGTGN